MDRNDGEHRSVTNLNKEFHYAQNKNICWEICQSRRKFSSSHIKPLLEWKTKKKLRSLTQKEGWVFLQKIPATRS